MVGEHAPAYPSHWAAIRSIAETIGCHPETLRSWMRRHERDTGQGPGLTTTELDRVKQLARENKEPRCANEILRKASAYFARAEACAELDRRGT